MIKLKPVFQRELFNKLLKNHNRHDLSKLLKKSPSILYHYKNCKVNSIPLNLLEIAIKLSNIPEKEFNKNILNKFSAKDKINQILNDGREIRKEKLKQWKKDIPPLKSLIIDNYLDFELWFFKYKNLIDFGVRKLNYIKKNNKFLEVSYTTHSNKIKKEFIIKFPRKILINKGFLYFFGLWVGDKRGGKRFGVTNKEPKINSFTEDYLIKLYQKPERVLYIHKKEKLPYNLKYDKLVEIDSETKGYSLSVHIKNGILTSFFDYLESNIDEFLYKIKDFNIFFAGLFDAEGNIFLEDSCFRWSCKNEDLIKIYKKHLTRLGLYDRFDGSNFVAYNKEIFAKKILPYIIHPKKINNTNLVCYGKGFLEDRFKNILNIIKLNPGLTNNELSNLLDRKKVYAQLRFLEKLDYIYFKDYPKQTFINEHKSQKL